MWAANALSAARTHGLLLWEGRALTVLAAAMAARGRRDDAARYAREALAACEKAGHRAGAADALTVMESIAAVPGHAG